LGRGLAQEHRSGMGSALGCLGRRCKAGSMALDGGAALGPGNSPECGVPVPGMAYSSEDLAQKKREGLAMLTEAWSGRGATQVASALRSGGEVRAALGGWSLQWSSGRQDSAARFGVLLRRSYGAQGGRRTTRGGEIVAAQRLTGGDVR